MARSDNCPPAAEESASRSLPPIQRRWTVGELKAWIERKGFSDDKLIVNGDGCRMVDMTGLAVCQLHFGTERLFEDCTYGKSR